MLWACGYWCNVLERGGWICEISESDADYLQLIIGPTRGGTVAVSTTYKGKTTWYTRQK